MTAVGHKRYFSNDGERVEFHPTPEAAQARAHDAMVRLRLDAQEAGSWSDSALLVCWGETREVGVQTSSKVEPAGGGLRMSVSYGLVKV